MSNHRTASFLSHAVYAGAAFTFFIILFVCGLILMFVNIPVLRVVYSGLGALLFSFFLLIDTQMIMGGNRQEVISPEEYILAVLMLYMDIINLFLHILSLLNSSSN